VITLVVFFVPYGLMTAELGAAWPGEGGLYVWVPRGLGPRWGSLAAWFYWINTAYWTPSVYMVFAGTFQTIFLEGRLPAPLEAGSGAIWLQAAIAILLTWFTVGIGVVRLEVAKWGAQPGAAGEGVESSSGSASSASRRSSPGARQPTKFSLGGLLPSWGDSLTFLPVLLYNAMGFELMSGAGDEMKHPQRDVPRAILLSGLVIAVAYSLGALGVLLAVRSRSLEPRDRHLGRTRDPRGSGLRGGTLVLLLGIGFLYACVANIVTWTWGRTGSRRQQPPRLGAGGPRAAPPALQHPLHGLRDHGVVSTLLLVGNAALSSRAESDNVFWMVFKLSGVCFLISYLMVFPAFLALRYRRPTSHAPTGCRVAVPAAWGAALVCTACIAGATLLFFLPPPTAQTLPARCARRGCSSSRRC